jgi:hypothetical protein
VSAEKLMVWQARQQSGSAPYACSSSFRDLRHVSAGPSHCVGAASSLQSACSRKAAVLYTTQTPVTEKCIAGPSHCAQGQLLQPRATQTPGRPSTHKAKAASRSRFSTSAASTSGPRYVMPTGAVC